MLNSSTQTMVQVHQQNHRYTVGLWGSCDPTTWRKDTLIPWLEQEGITYYNPQIENYDESRAVEYAEQEAQAANEALIHFMVIDSSTRALVSLGELLTFLFSGKVVIPVIEFVRPGTEIAGQTVSVWEAEVVNEPRRKIRMMLQILGIPVFSRIEDAIENIEDAILNQDSYRITDIHEAADLLGYQYEDAGTMTLRLPSDPDSAVEEMYDALILSYFYEGQIVIFMPSSESWQGQSLSDGTPLVERRLKDWARITMPYFARFANSSSDSLSIYLIA